VVYELILKPSAQKDLNHLPDKEVIRLSKRIAQLSANPQPVGIQKLSDNEGYRIRIGDYRILFNIDQKSSKIFIYRIKHRKDVYRKD
jgi:mRNA interferase RelE/StbE